VCTALVVVAVTVGQTQAPEVLAPALPARMGSQVMLVAWSVVGSASQLTQPALLITSHSSICAIPSHAGAAASTTPRLCMHAGSEQAPAVCVQVQDSTAGAEAQLQELVREEGALAAKLEKRRAELERSEKRLATLASVRPAYMDEYERLQGELQVGAWGGEVHAGRRPEDAGCC
jgi:hypothetical protein